MWSPTRPLRAPTIGAWLALALGSLLIVARVVPLDALRDGGLPMEWTVLLLYLGAALVWAFLADAGRRAGVRAWPWALAPFALVLALSILAGARIIEWPTVSPRGAWAMGAAFQGTYFAGAALAILVAARAAGARTRGLVPWLVALPVLAALANPLTYSAVTGTATPAAGVHREALAAVPLAFSLALLLVVHARAPEPRPGFALGGALVGGLGVAVAARAAVLAATIRGVSGSLAEWNHAFALTRWAFVLLHAGIVLAAVALTVPPRAAPAGENAPSATTQRL